MPDRVGMKRESEPSSRMRSTTLFHVQDEIAFPALRCDSDRKIGSVEFIVSGRLRSYAMSRAAVSFEIGSQRS